ncbi:MAG: hypothetical protein HOV81_18750 [Kofleriaceae bacterium]|nr:hypothetical protein [Kofleriaceae bacterium]
MSNAARHPRYLHRRVEALTGHLRNHRSAKALRDAIRANGLDISWTVLAGASGDPIERGLLITPRGDLIEFELPPGASTFARWHTFESPTDLLRERYPGLDIALSLAAKHHLFSNQQPRDALLDSLDGMPPDLAHRIEILPDDEASAIRARAADTFTDGTVRTVYPGALVGYAQVTCDQSWKLIADFPAAGPVVLFTNREDGETMFLLATIRDAVAVVGEMYRADFYLVDRDCTFLFAADEYDTLFGCGTAALFVAKL